MALFALPQRGCVLQPGVAPSFEALPRVPANVLVPQRGFVRWHSCDARNETKPPPGLKSFSFHPRGRRCANPGLEDGTPVGLSIKSIKAGAIAIPILCRCGSGSLKLLDAMTGEGKQAMLLICYFGIAKHISFEILLLLPLLIWLLRQNKLRQTQNPGESHEN